MSTVNSFSICQMGERNKVDKTERERENKCESKHMGTSFYARI